MDRSTDHLIEDVFEFQRRIVRALRGHLAAWTDVDLTRVQLKTLVVVVDEGRCSIGRIAAALAVSLPNASQLVDMLVRVGLAQREEDVTDRRRTLASPTPQDMDVLRNMRKGGREQVRAALRRVSRDDLDALSLGLDALAQTLENAAPEMSPMLGSPRERRPVSHKRMVSRA